MENLIIFLAIIYLFSFVLGRILRKINIPASFAPLFFGILLAVKNPFSDITSSDNFKFLAFLGMYFMLFLIGFEIDFKDFKRTGSFIIKSTIIIVLLEALVDGLFFKILFHYELIIAFVIALIFATVGEEILLPILEEFKLLKTKVGQSILKIGVLDNFLEFLAIILISFYLGITSQVYINIKIFLVYIFLFLLLILFFWKERERIKIFLNKLNLQAIFLFLFFIFFVFIFIGEQTQMTALALIIGGLLFRHFIKSREKFNEVEQEIKTFTYSLFGPIFFVWVGQSVNLKYILEYPFYILIICVFILISNILASFFITRKELGPRGALLLGVSFCVKFSSSIVLIKVIHDMGVLNDNLYSVLVGSSIFFVLIPPILFSLLVTLPKKIKNKKNNAKKT